MVDPELLKGMRCEFHASTFSAVPRFLLLALPPLRPATFASSLVHRWPYRRPFRTAFAFSFHFGQLRKLVELTDQPFSIPVFDDGAEDC